MSAITLSPTQVAEVLAPSKRYDRDAYAALLADVRSSGKPLGHVESTFPGVKVGHVVFMLKQLKGDAKDLVVDSHGEHGVCVIPVAPAAKAPAAKKPAAKTPAAKPAAKRVRKTA